MMRLVLLALLCTIGCMSALAFAPKLHMGNAEHRQLSSEELWSRRAILAAGATVPAVAAAAVTQTVLPKAGDDGYRLLERIYDTSRGSYLPARPSQLIRDVTSPVWCLGEVHSHPLHHRVQFLVVKALHRLSVLRNEPFAIGLEMCYRQQQAALDRYIHVHGNLAQLKQDVAWRKTWGYDFNHYSKLLHYARINGIRLVGLNAPQQLISLVAQRGISDLPENLKELLPSVDLDNEKHRARFQETMKGMERFHGPMPPEVMQRFYEAQTLWDEYMASSAAGYLKTHGGSMAILAGNGHVENRDGLPDRIQRRIGVAPFTVVPDSVAWQDDGLPEVEVPPGKDVADWIWYTERELPPAAPGSRALRA